MLVFIAATIALAAGVTYAIVKISAWLGKARTRSPSGRGATDQAETPS